MTAIRRWQIALITLGLGLLIVATVTALQEVPPDRWIGIAGWLIGALIIHDGIAAMAMFGVSVALRRSPIPFAVVVIIQAALAVGTIVTVLVLPAIIKQAIGTANPSILPLDYLANLGLFWLVLLAITGGSIGAMLLVSRRRVVRAAVEQKQ